MVELSNSSITKETLRVCSFLPGYGVSEAGGVLVGRYLGAGKRQTAARAVRSARWLAVMAMGLCGAVFALGGQEIAGAFTKDPEVARIAGTLMFFAAAFQIFDAVAMAHLCALRNAGDTRFTLESIISVIDEAMRTGVLHVYRHLD